MIKNQGNKNKIVHNFGGFIKKMPTIKKDLKNSTIIDNMSKVLPGIFLKNFSTAFMSISVLSSHNLKLKY
jgi:hypothetical protein